VKNVTVAVPDAVYRAARVRAAQMDTSVSALVADKLRELAADRAEFARLAALQDEVTSEIKHFRAGDRLSRDEVHDRALR
jgi:uncharacterized protein YdcH (DUF465 family)